MNLLSKGRFTGGVLLMHNRIKDSYWYDCDRSSTIISFFEIEKVSNG